MRLVRILVVEDEVEKRNAVKAEIRSFFGGESTIEEAVTFGEGTQKILQSEYDLIVVDLLLPRRRGDDPTDISEEIVDHLTMSEKNRLTTVVAISRFDEVVVQRRTTFMRAGIFLTSYSKAEEWKSCLRVCMQRVSFRTLYDFVVICALDLERTAFEAVSTDNFEFGDFHSIRGLDAREMKIGDLRGVCVLQPRMGLVDASITAARALEAFNPRLICMAGICAGFQGEVELGALIVSEISWEHQAGKWRGEDFEIREYQEPIDNDVRTILSQMIEKDRTLLSLASRPHEIAVPHVQAGILPTVSGSAVIASTHYSEIIRRQHGKVAGVDMEVYGVHRAAALFGQQVICFAAKTVVDHADEAKSGDLQQAGAILSARFVVKAIRALLAPGDSAKKPPQPKR